jgi:hypothetical protein
MARIVHSFFQTVYGMIQYQVDNKKDSSEALYTNASGMYTVSFRKLLFLLGNSYFKTTFDPSHENLKL